MKHTQEASLLVKGFPNKKGTVLWEHFSEIQLQEQCTLNVFLFHYVLVSWLRASDLMAMNIYFAECTNSPKISHKRAEQDFALTRLSH